VAPKKHPAEIVERLDKVVNAALGDSKIKSRFAGLGLTLLPASQAEFGAFIAAETKKLGRW
jgi:tripartite-type tricarboxylate transporter receptor subunit TctC